MSGNKKAGFVVRDGFGHYFAGIVIVPGNNKTREQRWTHDPARAIVYPTRAGAEAVAKTFNVKNFRVDAA